MLSRSFLPPSQRSSILAYSPMFHARLFAETQRYRDAHFQPTRNQQPSDDDAAPSSPSSSTTSTPTTPWLDGNPSTDRPLFVQFCANDPDQLLAAARLAAPHCDAVDLNLGCPQGIARKGHYGAFLQEDQDLIYRLINTLHVNLPVPVTAKIRILDTREATLEYARMVLRAGASILTVHGRRREQKGHMTGLADWAVIRYLRENLPKDTVLFANGNVLGRADLDRCLDATGADAVMTAEGHLSDPAIFAQAPAVGEEGREYWRGKDGRGGWRVDAVFRRYLDILHQYALGTEPPARKPLFLPGDDMPDMPEGPDGQQQQPRKKRKLDKATAEKDSGGGGGGDNNGGSVLGGKSQSPNFAATQPHLFHLLRHFVSIHHDVRNALAKARAGGMPGLERILTMVERKVAEGLVEYEKTGGASVETVAESKDKANDEKAAAEKEEEDGGGYDDPESSVKAVKEWKRPWWVAQPIIRPLPKEAIEKGAITLKGSKSVKGGVQGGEPAATKANAKRSIREVDGASTPGDSGDGAGNGSARVELERKTSFHQSELVSG